MVDKHVKKRVESLLQQYPYLQDNDNMLILAYLNAYHGLKENIDDKSYQFIKGLFLNKELPAFNSIVRIRQKFQQSGKYLGKNKDLRLMTVDKVKDFIKNWDIKSVSK